MVARLEIKTYNIFQYRLTRFRFPKRITARAWSDEVLRLYVNKLYVGKFLTVYSASPSESTLPVVTSRRWAIFGIKHLIRDYSWN